LANPDVGAMMVEVMVDRLEVEVMDADDELDEEEVVEALEPPVAIWDSVALNVPVPPTKLNLAEKAR